MSGFDPHWLALREPADHAARDKRLLALVADRFAARQQVDVVDLGAGAGSNLRALAPHLPARQSWTLVDHDPALLDTARRALLAWAEEGREAEGGVVLDKSGKRVTVAFRQADLARDIDDLLMPAPDLVTAAALFDLVSEPWLRRFTAALVERGAPLYAVLTYDGLERWSPPHRLDEAVLSAFHLHQQRDKGFGPAAGPRAAGALAASLVKLGYSVRNGDSPWQLGAAQAALVGELASGIAQAAVETGRLSRVEAEAWVAARRQATAVEIGHRDLWAEKAA
ncbi:MAG: class I SAM-dependent methyltransferase [Alsobacter sp.]